MKTFGSKRMGWVAATLALLALSLTLATPTVRVRTTLSTDLPDCLGFSAFSRWWGYD